MTAFVEITSGLLPADEVVTRGAYSLVLRRSQQRLAQRRRWMPRTVTSTPRRRRTHTGKKAEMEAKKGAEVVDTITPREVPARCGCIPRGNVLLLVLLVVAMLRQKARDDP